MHDFNIKYVYTHKLDDIVNKYNSIYHCTIKVNLVNVKWSTYINSSKEIKDENAKFKIGDIARISNTKTFFAKGFALN